tara:strand:- start:1366 stop:2280 length:915 start_codon:yes stop_codon:yes gene_type:complete
MHINKGFILAAGFGTRMGEIGQLIPKVLWPVFDTTLLGLQIKFLNAIGVSDISVNLHHQRDKISQYLDDHFSNVHQIVEMDILDSGGGVQNYISIRDIKETFVCLNSDQYLAVDSNKLKEKLILEKDKRAKLFITDTVGSYSSLIYDEQRILKNIESGDGRSMFVGLSLINASGLKRIHGKSRYFETVSNYKKEKVEVNDLDGDYLDFGEISKYQKSCFDVLDNVMNNDKSYLFWERTGLLNRSKINSQYRSYNCKQKNVLNFSKAELQNIYPEGSIVLKECSKQELVLNNACIVYGDVMVEIK